MKISGTHTLVAPPEQVWTAFNDPAVLARALPGCESLTEIAPGAYAMTITTGVAAIRGTYDGHVAVVDPQPPGAFTLKASGAGGPGTVSADVKMCLLASATGGTQLSYDADAVVGGVIGGVGQRMLSGVAKKMAGQFFAAVDADIAGVRVPAAVPEGVPAPVPAGVAVPGGGLEPAAAGVGATYPGSSRRSATAGAFTADKGAGFVIGVVLGGALALAGVALGARIARRG